jgi:hypothetical protein
MTEVTGSESEGSRTLSTAANVASRRSSRSGLAAGVSAVEKDESVGPDGESSKA